MKYIRKILVLIISFLFITVFAEEDNLVNIYFFHSKSCPHCKSEIKLLNELEDKYSNIKIYKYEINDENNSKLFQDVANLLDVKVMGTPFTVIGNKSFSGYSDENSKRNFEGAIEYYSKYGYDDVVGKFITGIELPQKEVIDTDISVDKYINNYGNYKINIPLIGDVQTKNLTLPVVTIIIGLLDGFNPCAMWILLFLMSMLIGMKNKKRMWTLGITFLLASSITYLLFMIAWLNVASLLTSVKLFRLAIALVALIGGSINLFSYFKHKKDNGCNVVDSKKRNKIFTKIKKFTTEKNFFIALIGVITLAVSVNIIELACSAGLPIMFIEILTVNNLIVIEKVFYIGLYILCFFLDDLIVFFIAMTSLELTGFSTKYGKLTKLIGGILLLLIGVLMLLKPEWLMFNF